MTALSVLSLFLVISSGLSLPEKDHVEPQYLDMLLKNGEYERFAEIMNIPNVDLVRPNEEARNENPMMNKELPMGDVMPNFGAEEESRQGMRFARFPNNKWPNQEIPYWIGGDYDENERNTIRDAIESWNSRVQCLKIRPWRSGDNDYVYIYNGNGCWSYLGNIRNGQYLSLQRNGCVWKSIVLHEFDHAAGVHHEQNRWDRDEYVDILWENIPDGWKSQYQKTNRDDWGIQEEYDYYSIMHYGMKAPGTNKDAFRIKRNGIDSNRIGRSGDLTETDVHKINTLYC